MALVAGGPPCQGFSVGGRRDGLDERNYLVYRMLDFIELVQPEAVLIENVEGMARRFVSKGPGENICGGRCNRAPGKDGLRRGVPHCGRHQLGVPQTRRRIAIFGFREANISAGDLGVLMEAQLKKSAAAIKSKYGLPLHRPVTVAEAIHDLSGEERVTCRFPQI